MFKARNQSSTPTNYSLKISVVYLKQEPKKTCFPRNISDGQTYLDEQTANLNYRVDSLLKRGK